jgi:hypothetical protein
LLVGGLACRRARTAEVDWQPDGGWLNEAVAAPACVYFKQLEAFLPTSLPGFRQARDEGSTGKYGDVSVSEAERVFFQPENREVSIRIVDSTVLAKLAEGIRAAALEASDRQQPDLAAPLSLPQALGYLRYDPAEERAEANLLVGDRFVVSIVSRGLKDATEVRRIAENLDSAGLSKLR